MNIRNFTIIENNGLLYFDRIKNRITEIDNLIASLYSEKGKEFAIEYNFGSIIQLKNQIDKKNHPLQLKVGWFFLFTKLFRHKDRKKTKKREPKMPFFRAFLKQFVIYTCAKNERK